MFFFFLFFFAFVHLPEETSQKNIAKINVKEHTACFYQEFCGFRSYVYSLIYYFHIWCEKAIQFDSFACSCPVLPALFIKEVFFPPFVCSCLFCQRLIHHINLSLFLGSVFCFIDLYVCFCAHIILF